MRTKRNFAGSTNDVTWAGRKDGAFYIGLTGRAFNEVDDFFSVSLTHSFIHSGGKPGSTLDIWTGGYYNGRKEPLMNYKIMKPISGTGGKIMVAPNHDLEWMGAAYNAIIESCVPGGKSRIGPARAR